MESLKELDKEIEEMEKVYNNPSEEEPVVENTLKEEEEKEVPEVVATPIVPDEIEQLRKELAESKKRFANYKGSTDVTIHDLRSELARVKSQYANLQVDYSGVVRKLNEATSTSGKSMFSEEDVDILGEPAVNALNKGVNHLLESKLKPLQEEVERSRKEIAAREAQEAKRIALDDYNAFLSKLGRLVPDYEAVNVDPAFLSYMKGVDEASGYPREVIFERAERAQDVGRIASFFNEFKGTTTVSPAKNKLESSITPTGVANPAPTSSAARGEVITKKFIDQFYNDFSRGKYNTKKGKEEAKRIESLIDKAVYSGQVM